MGEIIRQTFNLYNTVGLVDKDKNIYFVPHQADIYAKVTASRTKVCDCYYELFNTVSPFSSKYQNTEISQWSPEDRRLVIEGTIDDFRQSRGQGLALNYLIMNRAIYEVEGETETLISNYYYAMFIDSVEQVGSRSVKLNLTPDYFTNFYYLNNNDTLTSTYDPFNPVMKNCFVERQHYDRFEKVNNNLRYKNLERILSSEETFKFKYQYKDLFELLPIGTDISITRLEDICYHLKGITTKAQFYSYFNNLPKSERLVICYMFTSYLNIILKENILFPVSYSKEASDNYTYAFLAGRPKCKDINTSLTQVVIPFFSSPKGFENIDISWFQINVTLRYVGQTTKSYDFLLKSTPNSVLEYLEDIGANQYILTNFVSKHSPLQNSIDDFYGYSYQYQSIIEANYVINIIQPNAIYLPDLAVGFGTGSKMKLISLTENSFGFLPSCGYQGVVTGRYSIYTGVRYIGSPKRTDVTPVGGAYDTYLFYDTGLSTLGINPNAKFWTAENMEEDRSGIREGNINVTNMFDYFVFVLGNYNISESSITLSDKLSNINVKNDYIDPLIESDPYTFYSLSIYETEQIISKMRTFRSYDNGNFTFKLLPILSYNDSYKVGFVPLYKIDNVWKRYYTDSIVLSLSTQLPLREDSWLDYYTVNKAQMKNQYAVQRNNFESGIAQAEVSGGASIFEKTISGLVKGGYAGAGAGLMTSIVNTQANITNVKTQNKFAVANIQLTQLAKMGDMGAKPDTVKLAGSDVIYDLIQNDMGIHINRYKIDMVSYNSACKYLERFGYLVNIFDSINIFDRIGFNFVKLSSFDFVEDDFVLSQEQMDAISKIFEEGVTLLHDHDYLHNLGEVINNVGYHNYELSLA